MGHISNGIRYVELFNGIYYAYNHTLAAVVLWSLAECGNWECGTPIILHGEN